MAIEGTYKQSLPLAHLIFFGALFLGLAAGFSFLAYSVFEERALAISAAESLGSKLEQEARLHTTAQAASQSKEQRTALQALPVQKNGGAAFIASLESLGKTAKVDASVFSVTATAGQGGGPGKLTLSSKFSGSYAACMRFIQMAETLPQSVSLSAVSLQYDASARTWSGTFTLSALSYDMP